MDYGAEYAVCTAFMGSINSFIHIHPFQVCFLFGVHGCPLPEEKGLTYDGGWFVLGWGMCTLK